jgi:hypothetical protein
MSHSNDPSQTQATLRSNSETSGPETNLRALWTAKGVPKQRQDEMLAQIAATTVRFVTIPSQDPPKS